MLLHRGRKLRKAGRNPIHRGGCRGMTGNHTRLVALGCWTWRDITFVFCVPGALQRPLYRRGASSCRPMLAVRAPAYTTNVFYAGSKATGLLRRGYCVTHLQEGWHWHM